MAQKLGVFWVVLFLFKNKNGEKKLLDRICIFSLLKLWNLSPCEVSRALG